MKSIAVFVNEYVDGLKEKDTFQARDISKAYRQYAYAEEHVWRLPYSDTIQRVLRQRRAEKGDVHYFDYGRSIWWKADHVATKEERCSRKAK